jgi:hypothetical protein
MSTVAITHRRHSSLSSLLMCLLVAVMSVVAVSLTAAIALSSRQRSFACHDAFEVKTQ